MTRDSPGVPRGKQGSLSWVTEWWQDRHCACWVFPLRAERAPLTQNQVLRGRGTAFLLRPETPGSLKCQSRTADLQTKVPPWPCLELSPRKQEGWGCVWPTCCGCSNALGSRLLRELPWSLWVCPGQGRLASEPAQEGGGPVPAHDWASPAGCSLCLEQS